MPHASVLSDTARVSPAVAAFFKNDRPRTIDRYIDYFGGESAPTVVEEHVLMNEELTA